MKNPTNSQQGVSRKCGKCADGIMTVIQNEFSDETGIIYYLKCPICGAEKDL